MSNTHDAATHVACMNAASYGELVAWAERVDTDINGIGDVIVANMVRERVRLFTLGVEDFERVRSAICLRDDVAFALDELVKEQDYLQTSIDLVEMYLQTMHVDFSDDYMAQMEGVLSWAKTCSAYCAFSTLHFMSPTQHQYFVDVRRNLARCFSHLPSAAALCATFDSIAVTRVNIPIEDVRVWEKMPLMLDRVDQAFNASRHAHHARKNAPQKQPPKACSVTRRDYDDPDNDP